MLIGDVIDHDATDPFQTDEGEVLNLRTLKPIDEEAILSAARQTRLPVTLEDHFFTGGLYSIVSETLVRNQVGAQVLPLATEERWFKPALLEDILKHEGFTGARIAERISARLSRTIDTKGKRVVLVTDAEPTPHRWSESSSPLLSPGRSARTTICGRSWRPGLSCDSPT